jgi:DNA-binding MarR family transcriptional regulator
MFICLLVLDRHYKKEMVSQKEIFCEVTCSQAAVHTHLKKLIEDGFLFSEVLSSDRRVKKILPTDKLLNLIQYTNSCINT